MIGRRQLTLKQAADRFSISEKEIVALVADKKLDYVWEQTSSGNLLLVYQDQLCDVAFLRDEDPEVFEKHLKSGLLRMMEAGATALTIEFLKNVEIDKLLELIQRLPQMLPGLAEESAEFEYKDEA